MKRPYKRFVNVSLHPSTAYIFNLAIGCGGRARTRVSNKAFMPRLISGKPTKTRLAKLCTGLSDGSLARMELPMAVEIPAVNLTSVQCIVWRKQDGIANPGFAKALT